MNVQLTELRGRTFITYYGYTRAMIQRIKTFPIYLRWLHYYKNRTKTKTEDYKILVSVQAN
jgi:hypothetical protein